ncbi:hypothetical protein NGA_0716800, partial [Nannochloropsis gaditana CCMP526]
MYTRMARPWSEISFSLRSTSSPPPTTIPSPARPHSNIITSTS